MGSTSLDGGMPPAISLKGIRDMAKRPFNREDEAGQILVMVGGGIVTLLLIAGLVIDTGVGFREKRDLQNSSDLAAMAGTKVISDHYLDGGRTGAEVHAAIDANLAANDCVAADGCTWTAEYVRPNTSTPDGSDELSLGEVTAAGAIPAGAQGVRVETSSQPETFFMRIVGIDVIDVDAEATAMASGLLNEAPDDVLLPIAAFDSDYEAGVEYQLTEGTEGPGNFGWLTWDGVNNNPDLAESICNPDNPAMQFPEWIEGRPGNKNGSEVRDCLDTWLNETVLIPIWAQTNGGGGSNHEYEIITLAAFTLTGYDLHASKVEGYFVEFYALPGVPAGYGSPPCNVANPTCLSRTNFIGLTR